VSAAVDEVARMRLEQVQAQLDRHATRADRRRVDVGAAAGAVDSVAALERLLGGAITRVEPPPPAELQWTEADGRVRARVTECAECCSTGSLPPAAGEFYARCSPCRCAKLRTFAKLVNKARLPVEPRDARLERWDVDRPGDGAADGNARRRAIRSVNAFLAQPMGGLLLSGAPGLGKTHLMVGIGRRLIHAGHEVLYASWLDVADQAKRSLRTSEGPGSVTDALVEVPILLLDEVGAGQGTDFERALVNRLIVDRFAARRPMVLATNYMLSRPTLPSGQPDGATEILSDRIGAHAADRLRSMLVAVTLTGRSQRESAASAPEVA